jgi:hypothetical protein
VNVIGQGGLEPAGLARIDRRAILLQKLHATRIPVACTIESVTCGRLAGAGTPPPAEPAGGMPAWPRATTPALPPRQDEQQEYCHQDNCEERGVHEKLLRGKALHRIVYRF